MQNRSGTFKIPVFVIAILLVCISVFPALSEFLVRADSQEKYIIWNADSDLEQTKLNGDVTATLASATTAFKTFKRYDSLGSYFSADFSVVGKGGVDKNAIFNTGADSEAPGYGWLTDSSLLKKISPFLMVEFDYRVTGTATIPEDAMLTMSAAYSTKAEVCVFGSVPANDAKDWKSVSLPLTKNFSLLWKDGFLNVYLTSASGGFSGTQTVDVRRVRLTIQEKDRLDFNNALKLAKYANISNFSKEVELAVDSAGNKDYFALFISRDQQSYSSVSSDTEHFRVSLTDAADAAVAFSGNRVKAGEKVSIFLALPAVREVKSIQVKTVTGEAVEVNTGAVNKRYSFTMPSADVTVELVTEKMTEIKTNLLWFVDPNSQTTNPWYTGASAMPYTKKLVPGQNRSAWEFEINNAEGNITIYGSHNLSYELADFYDSATLVMNVKLETKTANRTLKIGGTSGTPSKEITVGDDWKMIAVPYKEIAVDKKLIYLQLALSNLTAGDKVYIESISIWTREIVDVDQGFNEMLDISHYKKSDKNVLLAVWGDTEAAVDPWNELQSAGNVPLIWDRAWYEQFQNITAWSLTPVEEFAGNEYNITFYCGMAVADVSNNNYLDFTEYIDTGYIEFFMKTDTDGLTLPLMVESNKGGRKYIPVFVKFDASKVREDGYMRVRIPFTYLYDLGCDMDGIAYIGIKGSMPLADEVFLSSFRFYSNYADVPEPEPIVTPKPEPERDLPLELDSNMINAVLDKENKILYVPKNTFIWEILASVTMDTEESVIEFFQNDVIDDEMTVLNDQMTMLIYRRNFYLDSFSIQYLTIEKAAEEEKKVMPQTGEQRQMKWHFLFGVSLLCIFSCSFYKKHFFEQS